MSVNGTQQSTKLDKIVSDQDKPRIAAQNLNRLSMASTSTAIVPLPLSKKRKNRTRRKSRPTTFFLTETISTVNDYADFATITRYYVGLEQFPTEKQEATTTNEPQTFNPGAKVRIPPVILHKQQDFGSVMKILEEANVGINYAKTTRRGVVFHLKTTQGFRLATRLLEEHGKEFHTYMLESEKRLKVIIRGIPVGEGAEKETEIDLRSAGYDVISVTRLKAAGCKTPIPMVMVHLPSTEESKKIFNELYVGHRRVFIETPKIKTGSRQCYRCQRFGHTQNYCRAIPRCLKCGEAHFTVACKKTTKDELAKCCNCNEAHPANYKGCLAHPKNRAAALARPIRQRISPTTSQIAETPTRIAPNVPISEEDPHFDLILMKFIINP